MLKTEVRNPKSMHIDKMSTLEMLEVMNEENLNAVKAVKEQTESIAKAVDVVSEAIKNGGRLFYIGAGTSGRLGVLDASECPPTFGVSPDLVVGIIAGGDKCLRSAAENAEDVGENGVADIKAYSPNEKDVVVGISVAGGAEYVLKALEYAKSCGSTIIGLTCNADSKLAQFTDIAICTDTGAEVVTGSTRMKAGTAHKLVLNMLTTSVMIKQGHVYENLMINLKPTNIKLRARVIRIVSDITGLPQAESEKLLEANDWNIKKSVQSLNK
jgi:N-acetylmuramic acid 6-phosphate etherase